MSDFISKDKRGNTIVFQQVNWDHAMRRGHFDRLKGTWQTVMSAFQDSTLVLDNKPLDGGDRRADERYVSLVVPWDEYLVVPVVITDTVITLSGQTLPPPVRIAWTAYTKTEIPSGEVLWKWPPDQES